MSAEIVVPAPFGKQLTEHLWRDPSVEQMAVLFCKTHRSSHGLRLLVRGIRLLFPDAFTHQSAGRLELKPEVNRENLVRAHQEGSSLIDLHTHLGEGPVSFSTVDDRSESEIASYLSEKMPRAIYGSVVMNRSSASARLWHAENGQAEPVPIPAPELRSNGITSWRDARAFDPSLGQFDRQIAAFGREFQSRISQLEIGILGAGGLGSHIAIGLAYLGASNFLLCDSDRVDVSNLNRLLGATLQDAEEERFKVDVIARAIKRIRPGIRVAKIRSSIFSPTAKRLLSQRAQLIVVCTDNHASRIEATKLSCRYLIPLVNAGVNLEPRDDGQFTDIAGEVSIPELGSWCLVCAGLVDAQQAARERAPEHEKAQLIQRGYLADTPAPSVYHLNSLVASLAITEIHNMVHQYKPLHRYLRYDELKPALTSIDVPTSDNRCLYCGSDGLLALGDASA